MAKVNNLLFLFFLTACMMFPFKILNAQYANGNIFNSEVFHDKEKRPCLQVNLEPEAKEVKNAWETYLSKKYKVGMKKNDPMEALGVSFPVISSKMIDFFTQITRNDGTTEMYVFARTGYTDYLSQSSHPEEYSAMRKILFEFVRDFLQDYYNGLIASEKKSLDKALKANKKTNKTAESLRSEKQKLTQKIEALQAEAARNDKELRRTEENISEEKKGLEKMNSTLKELNNKVQAIPR